MKLEGKIENIYRCCTNEKKAIIEIKVDEKYIEELKKINKVDLTMLLEKTKNKRSLAANNYMWELLGKCSVVLKTNNEELYKKYVREYGIYRDYILDNKSIKSFKELWKRNGLAWFVEVVDFEDTRFKTVRAYFGTSIYTKKQMSRILNAIVEDAKAAKIETKKKEEIEDLLNAMDKEV